MSEKEKDKVRKGSTRSRLLYELSVMEKACVELRWLLVRPGDLCEDEIKRMGWRIWKRQDVIGGLLKKLSEERTSQGDERKEEV